MKKIFVLLLTICQILCLLLSGCASNDGVPRKTGLTIVTTNFFLYDMARTILGDSGEAVMLITPGAESHDFELTLADMAKIETCDLFVYMGGEGESWVYDALDSFAENGVEIPAFCAMEAVEASGTLCHSAGEHDHDHAAHSASHWEGIDDHVWLSVSNAMVVYEAIRDEMRHLYEDFQPKREDIRYELTMLEEKLQTLAASTEKPFLLVADRFPYRYLTEAYGMDYLAAFEGCTSDTEPSLETVNRLVEAAGAMDKPVLLVTELSDRQTAEAVAAQVKDARIEELHSCHNVTKEDFAAGVTYLELMERNYAVLEKLWK